MSQILHPLFGEYLEDTDIALAIPLPSGIYAGMAPVISGPGGSSGWTVTLQLDADGWSLWRTRGNSAQGRFLVQETGTISLPIAAPDATNSRIDLVVGIHSYVAGPVDPTTLVPTGVFTSPQMASYAVIQGTPSAAPLEPTVPDPYSGSSRAVVLARITVPPSGTPTAIIYPSSDLTNLAHRLFKDGIQSVFHPGICAAIGGYPLGAVLMLNDKVSEVICTSAYNFTDPNSSMAGWAPYGGAAAGLGNYAIDTGVANAYVADIAPAITANKGGEWVIFKAAHANTAASTLNIGGGVAPLLRKDGAPLQAADIVVGSLYEAFYDAATLSFYLTTSVPSQTNLFVAQHDNTGSRALGTVYTNTNGKPMLVMVSVTNGGASSNLVGYVGGVAGVIQGQAATGAVYSIQFMVPDGATYEATISSGGTLLTWAETY